MKESKSIIAVNKATTEVKKFKSINEAARELGSTFGCVQNAVTRLGCVRGWKIYASPEMIKARISELQSQLDIINRILQDEN